MRMSTRAERQKWVVFCDPLTIASIKALAAAEKQSIGMTIDQAVEYFSRKVLIDKEKPFRWELPDDF